MKEKLREANGYERRIALNCMEMFRDERKNHYLMNVFTFGILFAVVVIIFCGISCRSANDAIKRFSGEPPEFENYENTILGEVYEYVSVSSNSAKPGVNSAKGYYKIVKQPSEIDYDKYDYRKGYNNKYFNVVFPSSSAIYSQYKDAPDYSRIKAEAKKYFNENIDARIAKANRSATICWCAGVALIAGFFLIAAVFNYKAYLKNMNRRLKLVEDGALLVVKAQMIGREESRYSRSSTSYKIEVQFEDGEKFVQEVKENQYEAFEAGTTCYIVKIKDEYGFYDEYDIVWEELCGADTIF